MADDSFLLSHNGDIRKVQLADRSYLHFRCRNCQRDFATEAEPAEWKAAHIGIFRFNFLDELTTKRWTSERCLGQPLLAEVNDLRHSMAIKGSLERPAPSNARNRSPLSTSLPPVSLTAK
jgi:hypothetical protein